MAISLSGDGITLAAGSPGSVLFDSPASPHLFGATGRLHLGIFLSAIENTSHKKQYSGYVGSCAHSNRCPV